MPRRAWEAELSPRLAQGGTRPAGEEAHIPHLLSHDTYALVSKLGPVIAQKAHSSFAAGRAQGEPLCGA